MDTSNSLPWAGISLNLLVEVVDESVVLDDLWLLRKLPLHEGVPVILFDSWRFAEVQDFIADAVGGNNSISEGIQDSASHEVDASFANRRDASFDLKVLADLDRDKLKGVLD